MNEANRIERLGRLANNLVSKIVSSSLYDLADETDSKEVASAFAEFVKRTGGIRHLDIEKVKQSGKKVWITGTVKGWSKHSAPPEMLGGSMGVVVVFGKRGKQTFASFKIYIDGRSVDKALEAARPFDTVEKFNANLVSSIGSLVSNKVG